MKKWNDKEKHLETEYGKPLKKSRGRRGGLQASALRAAPTGGRAGRLPRGYGIVPALVLLESSYYSIRVRGDGCLRNPRIRISKGWLY